MAYSSNELHEIVQQARRRLQDLDPIEARWHQIESGSYNYKADIPKRLGDPLAVVGRSLTGDVAKMEAALDWPLRATVNIPKSGPEAEGWASSVEAFFAHFVQRTDPRGLQRERLRKHAVRSRFGAALLSVNPHRPPKDDKEREDYEETYWRWRIETLDPSSVGMLDRNGELTLGVVEEEIPILDLVGEYGKASGKDGTPLELLGKEYSWLRAADGRGANSLSEQDLLTARVKRYLVDDAGKIKHLVEQTQTRDPRGRYTGAGLVDICDELDNTFGMVSLFLFTGIYRPHAPMSSRFEALMGPLCEIEYIITLMDSIEMTIAANPRFAEGLPEAVAMARQAAEAAGIKFSTEPIKDKDEKGQPILPMTMGSLLDYTAKLPDEWWRYKEQVLQEREYLRANLALLTPSPDTIEKSTAAAVLYAGQQSLMPFKSPLNSITTGFEQIFYAVAHDAAHFLNGRSNPAIEFSATGNEVTRKPLKAGERYKIGHELFAMFPNKATISVEIVAETDAQRQAVGRVEMEKLEKGLSTPQKVLEAYGSTDPDGDLAEIDAIKRYDLLGPMRQTIASRDAIRLFALTHDRNEKELLALAQPQPVPGSAPGGSPVNQGVTVNTPAGPLPASNGAMA